jgi:RNA polymerase sigma factor (sigma-70 family)
MERIGPDILGRLFDEHAGVLLLFARQWCDAPEDIVQDAFASLARQKPVPERVVPWLYRVVRNGAISASRQSRRRKRREGRAAGIEAASGDPWFAATDDRIDAELASRLLADLDDETRETIVGRLWGGLTFEEIARLQGCSLSTAHRRYQAGLARLQARLEPQWTSNTPKSIANST